MFVCCFSFFGGICSCDFVHFSLVFGWFLWLVVFSCFFLVGVSLMYCFCFPFLGAFVFEAGCILGLFLVCFFAAVFFRSMFVAFCSCLLFIFLFLMFFFETLCVLGLFLVCFWLLDFLVYFCSLLLVFAF